MAHRDEICRGFYTFLALCDYGFFMAASIGCLGLAVKEIPAATAYAVWTGGSIAAVAIVGVYLFNEPATLLRFVSIALILLGMVGLRLSGVDR